ncbi:histidinol dehydrogenase [Pseudidiomarina planktonica]|uniref:Histidinol dehydrogenase n=1 Tax=Pseudidiomarina planktonica TaxID=1323738 RepID=A0A1Y6F2C8_9GAMM|nr:histidinol dehydrogenase [Pseudidiomarina planktonica]RUO64967.1 histidinol dehydrogenase [Pseudidiomarina planktonica]SMQ68739.1 histidinol dehydrogenase [Pseudidiomarina planktonica]
MQLMNWQKMSADHRQQALARPVQKTSTALLETVQGILTQVKAEGDAAVLALTEKFDKVALPNLRYSTEQIDAQAARLDAKVRQAIDTAYDTIKRFHEAQRPQNIQVETRPGVTCEQRFTALQSVGLYVPGGTATLPSTALMLGVPAQIAGCQQVVLVSPPDANGDLSPALMYAAQRCGITEVYRCGGAQAIAALAFGTETVPRVDKVFGPGNSYVTAAKQLVAQRSDGCAMDMPAGPSELLVIADATANPAFVAADLLSQAEHGADSQVILLTTSAAMLEKVEQQLMQQLAQLSRRDIATQALASSALIQVADIEQAVAISQDYAPEHLSLQFAEPQQWLAKLTTAGSVFVGDYTPEAGGDYATGTNHVLPTYGFSKVYSSLGLLDFYRRYTVQTATKAGLAELAEAITTLADTEGLDAHKRAVTIRMEASS